MGGTLLVRIVMAVAVAAVTMLVGAEIFRPELSECRDTIMIRAACAAPRANSFFVAAIGLIGGLLTLVLSGFLLRWWR